MRRLLHLAWFDTLAMRVPLALWGAVLLIEGAVFYFGPIESPSLPEFGRMNAMLGLVVIRMVASVVIIALLIHADPTVGTTAFWRSRPISRLALLGSKLLSTALWLVVLPGVVTTVVLSLLGMNLADAATGGSMTSYEQAVFVSMALALAIVTKDLVQFIVAAVIGIGILYGFGEALLPAALSTWPGLKTTLIYLPRVKVSTIVIGLVGVVAIYQYLTLRIRYSIAMLTCVVVVAAIVPRFGGARYSTEYSWPAAAPTNLVSPTDVALSVDPGTQGERTTSDFVNNAGTRVRELSAGITLSGEPRAIYLAPAEVRSTVEFQDHVVTRWSSRWPVASRGGEVRPATAADQPIRSMREALGSLELIIPPSELHWPLRLRLFALPEGQYVRRLGQAVGLDAVITLLAYQHDIVATLPLRAGTRMPVSKGSVLIESASRTSTEVTVVLRETSLERYYDQSEYWWGRWGHPYVLRNATRRLAIVGHFPGGIRFASYTTYFANTRVVTIVRPVTFTVPNAAAGGPVLDDEWMKGAELVRLDTRLLGTVTRPLRIENFVLGGEQKKEEAGSKK